MNNDKNDFKLLTNRCRICNRELHDPNSIRLGIGPTCRNKIEKKEKKTKEMWKSISDNGLESILAKYNNTQDAMKALIEFDEQKHLSDQTDSMKTLSELDESDISN